jgi:hypothetical protein
LQGFDQGDLHFVLAVNLDTDGTGTDKTAAEINAVIAKTAIATTYKIDFSVYALGHFAHSVFGIEQAGLPQATK